MEALYGLLPALQELAANGFEGFDELVITVTKNKVDFELFDKDKEEAVHAWSKFGWSKTVDPKQE